MQVTYIENHIILLALHIWNRHHISDINYRDQFLLIVYAIYLSARTFYLQNL